VFQHKVVGKKYDHHVAFFDPAAFVTGAGTDLNIRRRPYLKAIFHHAEIFLLFQYCHTASKTNYTQNSPIGKIIYSNLQNPLLTKLKNLSMSFYKNFLLVVIDEA
jgi:hypothetical protein